jgi:Holliday junction resolvase RusA-like endonuclease
MILYKTTIPINPKTKKNSMQMITKPRPRLIQSKAYRQYESDCLKLLKPPISPLNEPLIVKATYYRGSRHRCDITNLNGALHDILVKAKVLEDDNYKIVIGTDGSRVYYDKENPRTEVEIYQYKEK